MQSDDGNLRRAVEPKGYADRADAAVDVELQLAEAEPSLDILSSHRRENQRTNQRQANLAAVSVAAEHERDGLPGGEFQQMIHIVGLMAEQNNRLLGNVADRSGDGGFRVRRTQQGSQIPASQMRPPERSSGR